MGERREYWWIRYDSEVRPAEVGFVGGIPAHIWVIGAVDTLPAAAVELVERLPAPPPSVFAPVAIQPQTSKRDRSGSILWFVGVLLLIFVAQCSGSIFDALK